MENNDIIKTRDDLRQSLTSLYLFLSKYHVDIDYIALDEMLEYIQKGNEVDKILTDWMV